MLADLEGVHMGFAREIVRIIPHRQHGGGEKSALNGCPEVSGAADDCDLHTTVAEHSSRVGV